MDKKTLKKCERLAEYTFADKELLSLALTHSSVAASRTDSNERLEFLGDAVLGLTVCEELFRNYDELNEGAMTRIKSVVVSRQTCATIAEATGLSKLLFLGKGMVGTEGMPLSVAAAVFEAIIGAIYIDGGPEAARTFILRHIQPHITEALATEHQHNYKSMLQQYSQRQWGIMPEYKLLDEKGPDHDKCFEVGVAVEGRHFPSAWGKTKKQAEQEAARQTLIRLELLEPEEPPAEGD